MTPPTPSTRKVAPSSSRATSVTSRSKNGTSDMRPPVASGGLARQTGDGGLDGELDDAGVGSVLGGKDAGCEGRLLGHVALRLLLALGIERLLVVPGGGLGRPAHGPLLDAHGAKAGPARLRNAYAAGLRPFSRREIDGAMGDSLKFGTSGLRGLASELQGDAARRY